MPSPARFLQEQGGVEGIIRGAKGAIDELKKNVQSMQAGSPPRQNMSVPQPSIPDIKVGSPDPAELTSRIDFLEARNKTLAKMLEDSLKGLWDHQKAITDDKTNVDVDALSHAIAQVQFVQVFLEDSAVPIPLSGEPSQPSQSSDGTEGASESNSIEHAGKDIASSVAIIVPEEPKVAISNVTPGDTSRLAVKPTAGPQATSTTTTQPSPFHHPRPSLAQSSFSWMLGEDQRRSSFVAASPFPPEAKRGNRAQGKAAFLFGDDKAQHADGTDGRKGEGVDVEGFTLGTLRGGKPGS